ncbi:hypothetical protein [Corallococcus exiguus]|uniref:hypothetical protein n=1 Tax=Corallococcus exiguus TaxID=83462 RepID=UPI0014723C96|nr:hypothetical protein [Corallococcus exiguus]NNB90527.1 hypothetical protein [Corallococcus exiguus]
MQLENGRYKARAAQGALGFTSGGKEQVAIEFTFLGNDGSEPYAGQSITWFGFFTDASLEHTIKALRACGWQGNDVSDLTGIESNDVSLVIENEEYEGKWSPKVRWVNPLGSGLALKQQMEPTQARSFAAQMRGRILAMEQGTGPRRAPAPAPARGAQQQSRGGSRPPSYGGGPPEPPPLTDEDMPF